MKTLLKWSVADKIIQIVNAKKFFNVNNMKNSDRVTSFTKFDIYSIIPEPRRVDFPCILQLTTFICQLMVFMAHAPWYESLPENFSWHRSSDLFWRFFQLTSTFCLSFLHLNFPIIDFFFFKQWQACKSSSLIDGGTGLCWPIFTDDTEH